MTVVDPYSHRGAQPGARYDQVQFTISVYVTGNDVEPAFRRCEAEGTLGWASAERQLHSIREAFVAPALRPNESEVRTAVAIQIGNSVSLVP